MVNLLNEAKNLQQYASQMRRDFHMHPELGFQEQRTSSIIATELKSLGMEVQTGIGKTGVVGMLYGAKPGKVVMLRFDMDALPIQEQTGAEYASINPGVMHACGHDGHVAVGLTVAKLLSQHQADLKGSVKFVFQPAEEGLGGAEGMIADRVLESPRPDVCFGAHLWNEKPLGWAAISGGAMMAGSEVFSIQLTGKGGHGALPNTTIDPVVAAAQIISSVQNIVSRNVSPLDIAVVSVTSIKTGDAFNVIPQTVELRGTIRTFEPAVREIVLRRFKEIVSGVGSALGCQVEIDLQPLTPALVNDTHIAQTITEISQRDFPELDVATSFKTMVSEDMAFFLQQVPGVFFMVGSANPARGLDFGHHHPRFDFDEAVLSVAASLVANAAMHYLK